MTSTLRMTPAAWWAVVVIGMSATLLALLLASRPTTAELSLSLAGIGVLLVGWFALGHSRASTETPNIALIVTVAVAAALGVAGNPNFAIMQALLYPIAWVFARSVAHAIRNNLIIATGVTVGFLVSLGVHPEQLLSTALTMILSLGFSLAMGLWISRMTALGEERGRLLAELQGAQAQIAALHREAGAASEREHLARELHDTIAQDLTGLVMLAQRARRNPGASGDTLQLIEEGARAALAETRALVAAGAAVGDPDADLAGALQRLADRFARETGVDVSLSVDAALELARETEVVVLRCVQEALGNARKHARASRVDIEVARANPDARAQRVRVHVVDDGIGFDVDAAPDGFGLTGMTERVALVDGVLSVDSAPGRGTRLVIELPLQREQVAP